MWRGAVSSAIRGKRGQTFLRELLAALDSLPEKKLIAGELQDEGGSVCALGAIGAARGVNMRDVDPYDREGVAATFNIAPALAAEIMFENDNDFGWKDQTEGERFASVRKWVVEQLPATPTLAKAE